MMFKPTGSDPSFPEEDDGDMETDGDDLTEDSEDLSVEDALPLIERANERAAHGRYDQAYALYRQILKLLPDDASVCQDAADFCFALGHNATVNEDYAQAIVWFGRAAEIVPDDSDILLRLGVAQAQNGDAIAAIRTWLTAVSVLNPRDEDCAANIENVMMCLDTAVKQMEASGDTEMRKEIVLMHKDIALIKSALKRLQ